jgi:methionyl-tRNA formyltransferase
MATDSRYLVVGSKPWNRAVFDSSIATLPGDWSFAGDRETFDAVLNGPYRYVFFLHWSWRVPAEIVAGYECVNFHMADVPYGRGGSPLQNLLSRGHEHTVLTALRMTGELDAGPVYLKRGLCLRGTAEEVYVRATELAADMIAEIVRDDPVPVEQQGTPVVFTRRRAADSQVTAELGSLDDLHDFIRMLDAEGYPHAFVEAAGFRFELTRSARYHDRIVADVTITVPRRERA